MPATIGSSADCLVKPLSWDTEHFGFPVGELTPASLDDGGLACGLRQARDRGLRLVYWATHAGQDVPAGLVREYAGRLADRKVTFGRQLPSVASVERVEAAAPFQVAEYPEDEPSDALVALAIAAGKYSRFHTDPRMPADKFEELYRTWIRRSALREIADMVLVVSEAGSPDYAGMVTIAVADGQAQIGLIAVRDGCRGKGIGALLMNRAHLLMVRHGARSARVVTQLDNLPACKLYERSGYRIQELKHYYHFWPQEAGRG